MLKLHHHPLSTYARRVRIALLEKNIAAELTVVDMAARAHRAPPYLALNPNGRVPTLEEDGFVLYESTAILGYLEATHPAPPLVPEDARGRALVDMYMKLCDIDFSRHVATIIFPKRFLPKERWNVQDFLAAQKEIGKHLERLRAALGDKEYMVGDRFSLVEICYIPFLEFLPLLEVTAAPNVLAWTKRLLARPSSVETKPPM